MSTNPYAAPRAQVADERAALTGNFVPGGRTVPAGNGWSWIASAWSIFRASAGTWIGMVLVLFVIMMVVGIIPFIGPLAFSALWPVFIAGMVRASRSVYQGGAAQFSELFAGFKERFGTLVAVGLISLAISTAIFIAVFAVAGVGIFTLFGAGGSPEAMLAMGATMLMAVLVAFALMLPLMMATWFAPALVLFHELGPVEAMKASFIGCLKNVLPFLLYGVVLFFAAIIASIPLMLGWLALGPVIAASVYTGYRDIYFSDSVG
jgi:uncharacterized membrane protein